MKPFLLFVLAAFIGGLLAGLLLLQYQKPQTEKQETILIYENTLANIQNKIDSSRASADLLTDSAAVEFLRRRYHTYK